MSEISSLTHIPLCIDITLRHGEDFISFWCPNFQGHSHMGRQSHCRAAMIQTQ